jgi:hypothetical protein
LQQKDGKFVQRNLLSKFTNNMSSKDEGILLFDANGDGNQDVYIASGGYQFNPGDINYQDRLFINDGKGNFKEDTSALPENYTSKLCVRAFDYNNDGRLDLFVSEGLNPGIIQNLLAVVF